MPKKEKKTKVIRKRNKVAPKPKIKVRKKYG
jgi:hypothetical protein